MSVDVSTLEIRVISDAVEQAEKRLRALEDQAGNTEKGASNLTGGFAKLAASVAATVSVMEGFEKLVAVTREFDVLNAGLITATGSAENAKIAFDAIQKFAATTPYDLQQVTQGFTKLVNYGLNPSEKALIAYGDTASAMGKSLNDMVEAVADASTGEFERLKEFGIRAAKQGDEIQFSFRGVTTSVKNNSEEIQSYLIALGENNFAGAMSARMNTLDGALSNLSDSWDALFLNISQQGVGDAIAYGVNVAIDALNHLNNEISSGKLEARLDAWTVSFRSFANDSTSAFGGVISFISDGIEWVYELNNARWKFVFDTFLKYPDLVNIAFTTAAAYLSELAGSAVITFEALKQSLNPFDDVDVDAAISQAQQKQKDLAEQTQRTISDKIALLESEHYFQSMLNSMLDDEIVKREELQKAAQGGALARFQVSGGSGVAGGGSTSAGAAKKGGSGGADSGPNDNALAVENLALKLQQEEQLFSDSYARRYETQSAWDVINDQAMTTTFSRRMEQLAAEDEAMRARSDRLYAEAESDYQRNQNQLQAWRTSGLITEQRYNQLSEQNLIKFGKTKEQIEKAGQSRQLSNAAVFAGAALNIASTLFADSKPIAIAAALMSTYQGASNALATLPFPANIAAAATVVAAGIAQVNNIRSTSPGGGGGGGASYTPTSLPGTAGNDLQTSTLPATATQSQSNETKTIYIAHEINGRPANDDDVVRLGSLRPLIEALNEEIKFGNLKVVM